MKDQLQAAACRRSSLIVRSVSSSIAAILALLVAASSLSAQQTAEIQVHADSAGQPILVNGRQMGVTPATVRVPPGDSIRVVVGSLTRNREITLERLTAGARIRIDLAMPRDTQPLPSVRTDAEVTRAVLASDRFPVPVEPRMPIAPRRPGMMGSILGGLLVGGAAFAGTASLCEQSFVSPGPSGSFIGGRFYEPGPHVLGTDPACSAANGGAGLVAGTLAFQLIRKARYRGRLAAHGQNQARFTTEKAAYDRAVANRERQIRDEVNKELDADQARLRAVMASNDRAVRTNAELPIVTFLNVAAGRAVGARTSLVPPSLKIESLSFADADGDSVITAGERASVRVRLRNEGAGPALNVQLNAKTTTRLRVPPVTVGTIEAGASREALIEVVATQDVEDGIAQLDFDAIEANQFNAAPMRLNLPTRAYRSPRMVVVGAQTRTTDGRTVVEKNQLVQLTVRVQNLGEGAADDVVVRLSREDNSLVFTEDGAANSVERRIGRLPSGEYRDITVPVATTAVATRFGIQATVTEATGRYGWAPRDIGISMNVEQARIAEVTIPASGAARAAAAPVVAASLGELLNNIPRVPENPEAIAIIIGNRTYAKVPNVDFAIADAEAMERYATSALGVRPGNVIRLHNATGTQLRVLFGSPGRPGSLRTRVRQGISEIFVFYSGHGAPDQTTGDAYIVPVDVGVNELAAGAYRVEDLYGTLAELGAKHVTVALDACFSGAIGARGSVDENSLIRGASPIGIRVNDPSARFAGDGATIFAAARSNQFANWYYEKGHGMFTYFFLKGMQGDADKDGDGAVTVGEMRAWLTDPNYGVPYYSRLVTEDANREQNPQVFGSDSRTLRAKPRR